MEIVLVIAMLVLCVICAFRESKLTGTYKTLGIFGRVKAYLALDFTFAGLFLLIASIAALIAPEGALAQMAEDEGGAAMIFVAIVLVVVGVLLYYTTLRKCPPPLRKRVIFDMIAVGLGITMKIAIFFLGFVWKIVVPEVYTGTDGKPYYVYMDGEVYDAETGRYGRLDTNADGSTCVKFYS